MLKARSIYYTLVTCISVLLLFLACKQKDAYESPAGYDFTSPEKFFLNNMLNEISGIAFINGNDDMVYAINDEAGKLYYFKPGDERYAHSKFGKSGDYEDLCIFNNSRVVVLKSDGSLYSFPVPAAGTEKIEAVSTYHDVLPAGEYEGISWEAGRLLVLCKNCPVDKKEDRVTVYSIEVINDSVTNHVKEIPVDLSSIEHSKKKLKFHPSCMAKHPVTNEWYIISSVNKMLIVLDAGWKYKKGYALGPALFKQPEGIAFNKNGDLYISNEGKTSSANILLFRYTRP